MRFRFMLGLRVIVKPQHRLDPAGAPPPPPSCSPHPSELYPFVFFTLQNRSNKYGNLRNTSTIIVLDKSCNSWQRGSCLIDDTTAEPARSPCLCQLLHFRCLI